MNLKSLKSLSLLPLVVGSAAAGVLALMSPAKAVVLTVNGTSYNVTSIPGSFTSNQPALQSTPWWGKKQLAKDFATAGLNASPAFLNAFAYNLVTIDDEPNVAFYSLSDFPNNPQYTGIDSVGSFAATPVPFDFDGGTIPAVVGAFVLAARWKARKSIASKTRTANPDVAVR